MPSDGVKNPANGNGRSVGQDRYPPTKRIDWNLCTIIPNDGHNPAVKTGPVESAPDHEGARRKQRGRNNLSARILDSIGIEDGIPLYVVSEARKLIYTNQAYAELAERCKEALPVPTENGMDSPIPAALKSVVDDVFRTGRVVVAEEKLRVDARMRTFTARHFPVYDDGALIAVGGTYAEETARVQAEHEKQLYLQRFEDFTRAASDWFWETDRNLCITMLSERYTAITGYSIPETLGRSFDQVGIFKPGQSGADTLLAAFEKRRPFRDKLLEMKDSDGRYLRFQISGVPVFDLGSGEFQGFRGTSMDMTQKYQLVTESREIRENLEHTLRELTRKNIQLDIASAEAESALRAKTEFLAAMSHELRTPLNAIIGFAEAMNMQVFGEMKEQYVSYSGDIMNAGRHLLSLINDVLDVAVIESGEITLSLEDVSLKKIIDQAANLVILRAEEKNLDTSGVTITDDIRIHVDDRRATQIFVNLLNNAVKFTPEGGTISIEVEKAGHDRVQVTVQDSGVGIPLEQMETVFEKFRQVGESLYTRKSEGTGLGLHISRELARRMGGDITLESQVGVGSRFTVELPVKG